MNTSMKKFLAEVTLFLFPVLLSANSAQEVRLRWDLQNEQGYFHEIKADNSSGPRRFDLDIEKAKEEGVEACDSSARQHRPSPDYCTGLAAAIAPVFDFAFESDAPDQLTLDRVEVECFKTVKYRGQGFSKEIANYELLLPTSVGTKSFDPPKPLVFTKNGTLHLRVWPDFSATLKDALDLEIRFHFHAGPTEYSVRTGRFTLRL